MSMLESSGCHTKLFFNSHISWPNYHKGHNYTYLPQYNNVQINFTAFLYQSDRLIKWLFHSPLRCMSMRLHMRSF